MRLRPPAMKLIPALRDTAALACLAATVLAAPDSALAAQRAFFIFQSPSAETVPGGMATNFAVTLTYSNASGTINNAVFTNGVSVMPAGQGVTVGLSSVTAPIADGGGTGTLPLTISATASAATGSYLVAVWATNSAFSANSPIPGVAALTNIFTVSAPLDTNIFTLSVAPPTETVTQGVAGTFSAVVTLTNLSGLPAEAITNGVTILGPDPVNVTAGVSSVYASPPPGGGMATLTLSITNTGSALPGSYQVIVGATNTDFTGNRPVPGVVTVTNTLVVASRPNTNAFTVGVTPATETVAGGAASTVTATVTLTNLSGTLAETITNSVIVSGPDTADITAGLSSTYAAHPRGWRHGLFDAVHHQQRQRHARDLSGGCQREQQRLYRQPADSGHRLRHQHLCGAGAATVHPEL